MYPVEAVRTYLEMNLPNERMDENLEIDSRYRLIALSNCPIGLYRFLFEEVGKNYNWTDRLNWTDKKLSRFLSKSKIHLLLYQQEIAGYFELMRHQDGSVELAHIGLMSNHLGKGIGKYLLLEAIKEAQNLKGTRLWLHTCTLDHPAALPNYIKRGFKVFKRETFKTILQVDILIENEKITLPAAGGN